jgi:hypothetical protein
MFILSLDFNNITLGDLGLLHFPLGSVSSYFNEATNEIYRFGFSNKEQFAKPTLNSFFKKICFRIENELRAVCLERILKNLKNQILLNPRLSVQEKEIVFSSISKKEKFFPILHPSRQNVITKLNSKIQIISSKRFSYDFKHMHLQPNCCFTQDHVDSAFIQEYLNSIKQSNSRRLDRSFILYHKADLNFLHLFAKNLCNLKVSVCPQ